MNYEKLKEDLAQGSVNISNTLEWIKESGDYDLKKLASAVITSQNIDAILDYAHTFKSEITNWDDLKFLVLDTNNLDNIVTFALAAPTEMIPELQQSFLDLVKSGKAEDNDAAYGKLLDFAACVKGADVNTIGDEAVKLFGVDAAEDFVRETNIDPSRYLDLVISTGDVQRYLTYAKRIVSSGRDVDTNVEKLQDLIIKQGSNDDILEFAQEVSSMNSDAMLEKLMVSGSKRDVATFLEIVDDIDHDAIEFLIEDNSNVKQSSANDNGPTIMKQ